MQSYLNNRRPPVEVVKDILKVRFPKALVAFVAGSFQRGEATTSSDIDLVLIFDHVGAAWRESFIFEGWPVEVFAHDVDTLNYFFQEVNKKDGVPSLPFMVLEGSSLPEDHALAYQLKSLADRVLNEGPEKWPEEVLYHQRYMITDLIDDLRDPRSLPESNILVGSLHEILGNFYFRAQGMWSASRKHIPRRLEKTNPELSKRWNQAFEKAYQGERGELIALAAEILAPHGGLFFDGYRREAPKEWRKPVTYTAPKSGELREIQLEEKERSLEHPTLGFLKLRGVKSSDVPQLQGLLSQAYRRLRDMGLNYNATFADEQLTHDGLYDGGAVLVVEKQNEIIGTLKLKNAGGVHDKKGLYLSRFAVSPKLQKYGIGTHLLNLAERIARREKYQYLQLDTAQSAEHLLKYYQGKGFQITNPIYYEGKTYTSWVLQKDLV
jgi:ribosomal protein S18 acetylase RimI-like enzyme/predicted nucleotidyltransferase